MNGFESFFGFASRFECCDSTFGISGFRMGFGFDFMSYPLANGVKVKDGRLGLLSLLRFWA